MQISVNQPKSKAYTAYLRMFHLGLQLAGAYWALNYDGMNQCTHLFVHLISYLAYIMILLNIVAIVVIRCKGKFPRCFFFVTYAIDLLLAGGVIAFGLFGYISYRNCTTNRVMFAFALLQAALTILMTFLILCCNLNWGQRYTNSPGNIVWAVLFLQKKWADIYRFPLLIIGLVFAIISFMTLIVNFIACKGPSSKIKKILIGQWILGLVLMAGCEAYAAIVYFTQKGSGISAVQQQARKMLAIFIVVNGIDFLFWLWGMKTLRHENGDQVRDDLFTGQDHINRNSTLGGQQYYTGNHNVDQSIIIDNNNNNNGSKIDNNSNNLGTIN